MKRYNATVQIEKMGTRVVELTEHQLESALKAWKNKRSVNLPSIGLIRGRSIKTFSYDERGEKVTDGKKE